MYCRGKDSAIRNSLDVVPHRRVYVVEAANRVLGLWSPARADRGGAFHRSAPAAFELVKGRVELSPLAAGKEAPFQRVLQTVIVLAVFAAGDLRPGAADLHAVEDGMVPLAR